MTAPCGGKAVSAVADAPVQPSLRRMRQFGVRPDRELGQNFLIDSNILGVIDRAAELSRRGRRARDRRRPGGALGVPRRARRATCTWSRSTSACARRCCDATDRARERHACTGPTRWRSTCARCDRAPDEGRREPALRDRRGRAAAHDRGARERVSCGWRWSSARSASGWPPAPGSGAYGMPSVIAQLACEVEVAAGDPAHGVPSRCPNVDSVLVAHAPARRRDRAGRATSPRAARARRAARSPTAARRSRARWRCRAGDVPDRARASRCARRWSSSATPRTCAPSASRPRTSARWRVCSSYEHAHSRALAPGEDQPRAVPRADARRATAARARDA